MSSEHPLVRLGRFLRDSGYQFTTITPASHARVNARKGNELARTTRDILGWSRPFTRKQHEDVAALLDEAGQLEQTENGWKSRIRVSTANDLIFVHSAFPTTGANSVFFGPDTYRYLNLLRSKRPKAKRAVDVGCGTGAGGIFIARHCGQVVLADINDAALELARINAEINEVNNVELIHSDILKDVPGPIDLVISNPPYLIDDGARVYRDGKGRFGEGLSIDIVRESMDRLEENGRLILYTATAIVEGRDTFLEAVQPMIGGMRVVYEEIDPDVFGDELDRPVYSEVERLAVVGLDLTVPPGKRYAKTRSE